jgi:hypothetical protein
MGEATRQLKMGHHRTLARKTVKKRSLLKNHQLSNL